MGGIGEKREVIEYSIILYREDITDEIDYCPVLSCPVDWDWIEPSGSPKPKANVHIVSGKRERE